MPTLFPLWRASARRVNSAASPLPGTTRLRFALHGAQRLSFCEGPIDPFTPVLRRLQERAGKLRARGPDYLLYALIDTVIDQGFPLLEAFGLEFEDPEDKIVAGAAHETLVHIHTVKRELILLRRI